MNQKYIELALLEATKAYNCGEIPIGAVIVKNNKVVSKGYNKKEKCKLVTKHAEIIAIEKASKKIKNWRLDECDIYVTLDPCPMCASAIKQARISNVYSCLSNLNSDNNNIIDKILYSTDINKRVNLYSNIEKEKSLELLKKFFQIQRNK